MQPPQHNAALSLVASPAHTVPATVAAIVPLAHHEEFHQKTTEEQRQRIALLLQLFEEIKNSEAGIVATCHRLALEYPSRGFSAGNLKTLYYAYAKCRDWRVLVPKWRGAQSLPTEFVEEFRRRCEANKRENPARAVMEQIKADWQAGKAIPGYGTWREFWAGEFPERDMPERYPFGFFPRGWSQSNLYTKQSTKAQRMLARRGFSAAKRFLPHMIRDTSGLRPMELITIDDFETDILVQARNPASGEWELVTCTGLVAMDVATRRIISLGLKPRFRKDDGRRMSITRADVQGLLYSVFSEHGLPRDYGVSILCENASAAITPDFEIMLQTLLGVQVARTGLIADKVLANGFVEKGGKPWQKGWLESRFNLAWNHAGAFPGQKGATYQLEPGDHVARIAYAEKLLGDDQLTPEQKAELQTGFWKFDEALTAYRKMFDFLEQRTNHKMQGFEELCDYALPDGSGAVTLAEAQRLDRDVLLQCKPIPRRESSRERWARITEGVVFVKPAEHMLALLLLTPKKCVLENCRITFTHLGEGYTFAEAGSAVLQLPEGTELLGYLDPAQPNRLHVTTLEGRYVGSVRRRGAVDITNREAIAAEAGEITRLITTHVLAPVRARHAEEDKALALLKAENERKLAEWKAALPAPADGKRPGISAVLATARPGLQPHHAAASGSLAAGIAADTAEQDRSRATAKTVQRTIDAAASDLTDEDAAAALARPDNADADTPQHTFSAEEIADLLRDDPAT